ncbi:MAG: VOC family protein [Chloroflexota bacterium]|nr:VOC family protein [Chloroflexota bacterium]
MSVLEMRVALTVDTWESVVAFYRDGLGLNPGDIWTDMGKGQIFAAGRATLEIFDPAHAAAVDQLEVGQRVSGQIRFAFEVPDVHAALARALQYGATLVHEPVLTPWNDLNARVQSPDGLQITLFQGMKKE